MKLKTSHVLLNWEHPQIEVLLLWLSLSTKQTWMTWQLVQNIHNKSEREMPVWRLIKKASTVIMLITKLLLLTGLTKLPVADCHFKCKCSPFCLGLQLHRAVSFSVRAGVPQGSMFGPKWCRILVITLVFKNVSWLNRCRRFVNRQRDGSRDWGTDG